MEFNQGHWPGAISLPLFDNEAISIQQGLKTLSKSFEKLISLNPNEWHSIQPVWSQEY